MRKSVYVASISDAKNGNETLKRVELRCEIQKPVNSNSGKINFLLAGASGPKGEIGLNMEKRVTWENISVRNIDAWDLKVGDDFTMKTGIPCKIVVKESTTPFYEGQNPKMNPSTGEILTKDGMEIYRNSVLTFDLSDTDSLIKHDVSLETPFSTEFAKSSEKLEDVINS